MARFEARAVPEADRTIVVLAGECDLASREPMTAQLLAALERRQPVFVDLAGLEFLDSSGVHALVTAHHTAQETGGNIYLFNARGVVADVLDLTGVHELLRPPAGHENPGR